jgi:ABC-2 type transport system permease protein
MLRFGQSAEIFAWGMNFVVMALSGVFNPVESMPGFLQPIAEALPTTKAFEALRAVLDGEPIPWGLLRSAFIGSLICLGLSIAFCTHLLKVFRRRGFVTRFS